MSTFDKIFIYFMDRFVGLIALFVLSSIIFEISDITDDLTSDKIKELSNDIDAISKKIIKENTRKLLNEYNNKSSSKILQILMSIVRGCKKCLQHIIGDKSLNFGKTTMVIEKN